MPSSAVWAYGKGLVPTGFGSRGPGGLFGLAGVGQYSTCVQNLAKGCHRTRTPGSFFLSQLSCEDRPPNISTS